MMMRPKVRHPAINDPHALIMELQRRDFVSFLMRVFPHLRGGSNLVCNWHHDAIAYELEQVRTGKNRRLLVTLPPRYLKSIMISVAWVAWMLGQDPRSNFVCVSYAKGLSEKHARDCRAIMQSAWYRELFPRTMISKSRSAIADFETTMGGGRLSTSIEGTLTGRGGDIIVIDDPIKPDDAMSDTVRNSVNEWYRSTLASRLNDKASGAILLVMQRLHEYDLAGQMLEEGDWKELSLPAIATEDAVVPLTRGRSHHRRDGDVLHPERESYATLMETKTRHGSMYFDTQYQQSPTPAGGNLVKTDWIKRYTPATLPDGGRIVQSWDTANKDGIFNDYSVCLTVRLHGNHIYLLNVWRKKVQFPDLRKAAIEQAQTYDASVMLIEDQASGQQLLQTLRKEPVRGVPEPIGRRPENDKVTRLAGVSSMIEAGQFHLPEEASWLADFEKELLAFPSSRHFDQVDALSQLLEWVRLRFNTDTPPAGPIIYTAEDDGYIHDSDSGIHRADYDDNDENDPWSGLY